MHQPRSLLVMVSIVLAACASSHEGDGSSRVNASLTPLADHVPMSAQITHPYFPLSTVRVAEFTSEDERVVAEVQDHTAVVGGMECLVLAEKEFQDGKLSEISYNYFAQDEAGNVYYFGEDVDEYKHDKVVSHAGAWKVGVNAKEPCLFFPGKIAPGMRFKRENSPPDAEEFDLVESISGRTAVPLGMYDDVVIVAEGDKNNVWIERKYYARGVGLISENKELNLVAVNGTRTPDEPN